jgi:ornithine cyclodeaminase/alanine dehydrogenase-like protein (mu-crystallin family)
VTLSLDAHSLSQNLSIRECVDQLELLYSKESEEIALQPLRVLTRIDENSVILTMPGYSKKLERFAVKIVSEYKNNPRLFGRKVQGGIVMLFDSKDGELLATMDSSRLTAIRTGALCGLATKLLSKNDSRKVGIVGSGEQARTQLEAVCAVRNIEETRVYSRDFSHAEKFAREMSASLKVQVEAAGDKIELRKLDSDILIVATNSARPVLSWKDDVTPGMHINSIGTLPERQELDIETIANSRLFVDIKDGVLHEAGDVMNAIKTGRIDGNHIIGDLSDILLGKKNGRLSSADVTLFKSVGFALLDVYAANKAYENARTKQKS